MLVLLQLVVCGGDLIQLFCDTFFSYDTVFHSLQMPMWAEQEEVIDGYCCSSGNVKASLTLAKKGHVPGEPIIYSIDIINKSDHSVEHMDLDLKQVLFDRLLYFCVCAAVTAKY